MDNINNRIYECLKDIGMPFRYRGYQYVCEALKLLSIDETYIHSLTKRLYPDIGKMFNAPCSSIERAMRYAIQCTIDNMHTEIFFKYFGTGVKNMTISEFLCGVHTYLKYN